MTGVVLCGGQSTRMGQDKGLLEMNGATWAGVAEAKFDVCSLPYVFSVAAHHYSQYSKLFPQKLAICDDPALPVGGPLKGILSVHKQMPAEDLFVLAVDMPLMPAGLINTLMLAAQEQTGEAYFFKNGPQLEPLCAVYTAAALCRIYAMVASGTLGRFSMHHVLGLLQTKCISLHADNAFLNCNTPDDLQKL